MTEIKPLFSFFNKNLIIKNKFFLISILIAGLIDFLTTFIGIKYFNLIENNLINAYYFPLGIVFWVSLMFTYIICLDLSIIKTNNKKYLDVKKEKDRIFLIKYLKFTKILLALLVFVVPIQNLILIITNM